MTSVPVGEKTAFMANAFSGQSPGVAEALSAKKDQMFADLMSFKTAGQGSRQDDAGAPSQTGVRESGKVSVDKKAIARIRQATQEADGGLDKKVTDKDLGTQADGKAQALVDEVAAKLNLTPEEVAAAMEALGMQLPDILNLEGLSRLVVNLSGETDMLSLVTNEALYRDLQDLTGTLKTLTAELAAEMGVTQEELAADIGELTDQRLQALQTEEVSTKTVPQAVLETEGTVEETPRTTARQADLNAARAVEGEAVKNTPAVEVEVEEMPKEEPGAAGTIVTDADKDEQKEAAMDGRGTGEQGAKENKGETKHGDALVSQQVFDNKAPMATPVNAPSVSPFSAVQTENIMRQITEHVRVHISSEVTEMEMQLHPESLGNIRLQLAMRDGALTAQFTAQNEATRAAIESQLVLLKENLNQQGIKVEAVEVTIASHGFERNLDQGSQQQEEAAAGANAGRGRRRIVLDGLEDIDFEEMDESERLTASMMAANGNQVDYLV